MKHLKNDIYRVRFGFDSQYIFLDFLLVVTAYINPDMTSPSMAGKPGWMKQGAAVNRVTV
jgi:hypothetical protein